MNWRFKRWIIGLFALIGLGTAMYFGDLVQAPLDPSLQLKAPVSDIIGITQDYNDFTYDSDGKVTATTTMVRYKYNTHIQESDLANERVDLRTEMSRTIEKNGTDTTSFGTYDRTNVNGTWYKLAIGTTTKAAYLQQTAYRLIPSAWAVTDTFTATGTWNSPSDVCTPATVAAWGGGGGGRNGHGGGTPGGSGGGGGGAYSQSTAIAVAPSTAYTVTVGTGGSPTGPTAGGDSWFNTTGTLLAKGGSAGNTVSGGAGGAAASGVGVTKFSGGIGGTGSVSAGTFGGGGGGAGGAGDANNGGNGGDDSLGTGGAAGTGGATGGGNGGVGGNGVTGADGGTGSTLGGAGGGGGRDDSGPSNYAGGPGARGQVTVTYTTGCGGTPAAGEQYIIQF